MVPVAVAGGSVVLVMMVLVLMVVVVDEGSCLDGAVANEDLCEVDAVGSPRVRAMT
jgi:hypothetical protein